MKAIWNDSNCNGMLHEETTVIKGVHETITRLSRQNRHLLILTSKLQIVDNFN